MAAEKTPPLFMEFIYGMPRNEVVGNSDAAPCQEAPDNTLLLCAPAPVIFLEWEWREMFNFNNLGELQQVTLSRQVKDAGEYRPLLEALIGVGWHPVFIETDGAAFDVLEENKLKSPEKALKLREDFESSALSGGNGLTIYFFPSAFTEKVMKNGKVGNYMQALDKASDDLRMATLMVGDSSLGLAFTAPILSRKNALRYGQVIKRK